MSSSDDRTDNEPADIAARAAELLNQNLAVGQPTVSAADLLDGQPSNGEITFQSSTGTACVDNCPRMVLSPPWAHVSFGLARAFGRDGADVTRSATVEVFSSLPPKNKMVPLWLPNGCGYGPVDGDTSGGAATPASPTPTPTPTPTGTGTATATASPTATASQVPISPVGTHTLAGTSAYSIPYGSSVAIKNLAINGVSNSTKKASIRAISPDGTIFNEYASADIKKNSSTFTVADFTIGTELSMTPGTWKLYAVIENNNKLYYSSNFFTVTVTGGPTTTPTAPATSASTSASASPTSIPVGCAGQSRGNFGQLDSPRAGGITGQQALALNFAVGLDHQLVPFDFGTSTPVKSCADGAAPIAGGQWDNVSRNGNNCIMGDTGNDGPWIMKGLVTGLNGKDGRLNASNGATSCPRAPGTRSNGSVDGVTVNNDVLSCFLRNGATLANLAQDSGVSESMLDPAVINSPRFVWLPIVVATDRAQKEFQPILDYVPAFITDETQTTAATSANGLETAGNSIKVLRLFAFNKDALPPNEQAPETDYDTSIANPVIHLIG
jgi:hypothetical protein